MLDSGSASQSSASLRDYSIKGGLAAQNALRVFAYQEAAVLARRGLNERHFACCT